MNRPGVGQQTLSCGSGQRVCCSDSQQQQQQLGSTDYDFSVFERHPGCLAPQVSQAQTTAGGRSGEQIKCILNQTRQDHTKTKTQIKQRPNKTHKGQAKSKVFSKSIPNNAITPDPWQVGAGVQRDLCVRPAAVRHTAQVPQAILVNMVPPYYGGVNDDEYANADFPRYRGPVRGLADGEASPGEFPWTCLILNQVTTATTNLFCCG